MVLHLLIILWIYTVEPICDPRIHSKLLQITTPDSGSIPPPPLHLRSPFSPDPHTVQAKPDTLYVNPCIGDDVSEDENEPKPAETACFLARK